MSYTRNTISLNEITSPITVSISLTGTDTPSNNRPNRINGGDFSAYPFAKMQTAVDSVSKITNGQNKIIFNLPNGSITGSHITGFAGGGTILGSPCGLILKGTAISVTLTTGPNSGTAGTGTSSTFLALPNGQSNWTASEMRGKEAFIVVSSGGGSSGDSDLPTIRAISDNTTTGIIPERPIIGLDNTSVFSILTPATTIQIDPQSSLTVDSSKLFCLYLSNNQAPIIINFVKFAPASGSMDYGVWAVNNARIRIAGCCFDNVANIYTLRADDTKQLEIIDCHFKNQAKALASDSLTVDFSGSVLTDGYIEADNSANVTIDCNATSCTSSAVTLKRVNYANVKLTANTNFTTPLVLQSVQRFENSSLTGSNPSAPYGIDIAYGGNYNLAGGNLSGTSDMRIEGQVTTWTNLSNQKVITVYGTTVAVSG